MDLLNATRMKAAYTMGVKPDGRELLVVVVKGTFTITKSGEELRLANKQAELVMADEFTGEPGFSAPKYESDFAPFKPRCDVILNGSAYAPGGEPTRRVRVGLQVGSMRKVFDVVGHRHWKKLLLWVYRSEIEPFTVMPFSYDDAFGGVDRSHTDEKKHKPYLPNIAGCGFHYRLNKKAIQGKPLPNTQGVGRPVRRPRGKYRPMSVGAIGRAWQPRPNYAGTYDQNWLDNVFPFLPPDFDDHYFQCAPEDQQIDHPRGGEGVVLLNLTPEGQTVFKLPVVDLPVTFYLKNRDEQKKNAVADTIIIEPDQRRFMMVWRTALPLKRNIFDVAQVVVGTMPRAWYRARELGKTWYPSLKELVDERVSERSESAEEFEEVVEGVNP